MINATWKLLLGAAAGMLPGCAVPGQYGVGRAPDLERLCVAVPESPGREVSCLRGGDAGAPRLIYIHGTPGSAAGWARYLRDPVPGFESIAVDRPGFGKTISARSERSGRARRTIVPSFAEQAAAIAPLLDDGNGRGVVLVGHSLGGPIAAWLAAEHPDRVAGLVILAGSLDPDLESWRWYNEAASWRLVSWAVPRGLRAANREVAAARVQAGILGGLLAQVRCPVVWVQGGRDRLVPPGNATYARRRMARAASFEVIELPKAGHLIPWRHEDVVRGAIALVWARAGGGDGPAERAGAGDSLH